MKIVSYRLMDSEDIRFGVVKNNKIINATEKIDELKNFKSILSYGMAGRVKEYCENVSNNNFTYSIDDVRLLPPIHNPGKIICVDQNLTITTVEIDLFSGANSFIIRPSKSNQSTCSGQFVIIIGKDGENIKSERSYEYIAGLTIMNITSNSTTPDDKRQLLKSGAIGPWILSADKIDDFDNLQIKTIINGEIHQDYNTIDMELTFRELIEYVSKSTPLKAGDMIAIGTPNAVTTAVVPGKYLKSNDVIEIIAPCVGTLKNIVK